MTSTGDYATTFQLIDTDDDGLITAEEFKHLLDLLGGGNVAGDTADSMFAQIDGDSDGQVTLEELSAYLSAERA